MAITRRAANRHTVVATGWTNPSNAYSIESDGTYATLASAKSATVSGDFGFPDVTTSDASYQVRIPLGAVATDLTYGSGYWVASGTASIAYATSPGGPWTRHANTFGSSGVGVVRYLNGYWICGNGGAGIWYRNAADPEGTWTQNTSGFGANAIAALTYGGGWWVAAGSDKIWWTTDPTATWTQVSLGRVDIALCASYANGYFVVGGGGSGSYFWYATDPTGTWTENTNVGTSPQEVVEYSNGYWIVGGDTQYGYLNNTAPTGSFTMSAIGGVGTGFVHDGTRFIIAKGGTQIAQYTTDPTTSWTDVANPATNNTTVAVATDGTNIMFVNSAKEAPYATNITSPSWQYPQQVEPGIPNGSTINSVKVKTTWSMTALVTGGVLGLQPRVNNANQGTETTKTSIAEEDSEATYTATPSLADLRVSETSDPSRPASESQRDRPTRR